jgi:glycosyltransferase involved in cell wall biosynthesis
MKVLIVSQYFWPENFRINVMVKSLVERGIHVDVLTGKPNYPEGKITTGYHVFGCQVEKWQGANVYRVPLVPRMKNSRMGLFLNYFSFVFFGLICGAWMVRGKSYDAIFVYGVSPILSAIPALFIGRLKRTKVITWVQDLWPDSLSATGYVHNRHILTLTRSVVRFIYRNTDLLLVQSKAFEEPVQALASQTPVKYYPNSVDDNFAVPFVGELPRILGLHNCFSVVFAGNIGSAQGVSVVVEAASILAKNLEIQFVILGDGSCRQSMLDAIKERNLTNLHLPGHFPEHTMPGFMQQASALLVTLTDKPVFTLTVPNKVQAYMASGKPIIACLNGEGARLITEAGAGLTTPAGDAKSLAETVLHLYSMTVSERRAMGDKGRDYYRKHFDNERLIDQLIEHINAIS